MRASYKASAICEVIPAVVGVIPVTNDATQAQPEIDVNQRILSLS
jgi:hypothetical protein